MKDRTKGKMFVALTLAIISMSLGCVCGMCNIGDEASKLILPATQSDDQINNTIDENPEKLDEITEKQDNPIKEKIKPNTNKDETTINKIINKNITIVENKTNNNNTTNSTVDNTTNTNMTQPDDNTQIKNNTQQQRTIITPYKESKQDVKHDKNHSH